MCILRPTFSPIFNTHTNVLLLLFPHTIHMQEVHWYASLLFHINFHICAVYKYYSPSDHGCYTIESGNFFFACWLPLIGNHKTFQSVWNNVINRFIQIFFDFLSILISTLFSCASKPHVKHMVKWDHGHTNI